MLDEKTQEVIFNQIKKASIVWMSPVCTWWSLSAGNTYWTKFRMPRNDKAITAQLKLSILITNLFVLC